ncbi:unnamed protein product [Rotaria socialis]|uniref:N-acetylgalactosaminide beta-1,3-galactosyltransferase n=1 Tax=Rotaria socialis TaxID=392032 RepID=A0A817TML4_9BILA|nr:unnamed protein product [Rotaria socialis]CAF3322954.1 unnamed protein product [Rotaria socialis]CAF3613795.1 unnamed protein product [Rotaria socialis]CAF3758689.1 unnamed protein product [Rotaria socialis]CAF4372189.1 unnamed protein product [Rotaria socialis]
MNIFRIWLVIGFTVCLTLRLVLYRTPCSYHDIPDVPRYFKIPVVLFHPSTFRKSFVCNYNKKYLEYPWINNRLHPAKRLKPYCSQIPSPTSSWQKAENYQENDIAFIIYTGASFYTTRATSVRETWISRVTNYYFLASKPYPSLPITIIKNTGEDYQSNTKKIFYGLESIFRQQKAIHPSKRHKWYFLVGCDTYVNVPHLLKQLDPYNFTAPYFIGGSVGEAMCFHKNGAGFKSTFVGGNTAHILSAALVEAVHPHLSVYIESTWPKPNHSSSGLSDVALSCLILNLGFNITILPGFWRRTPQGINEEFGLKEIMKVLEPSSWHYIHPALMIDLDEFYTYQYVDRLKNDQKWTEILEFIYLFIGTHYETLRKHQSNDTEKLVRKYR